MFNIYNKLVYHGYAHCLIVYYDIDFKKFVNTNKSLLIENNEKLFVPVAYCIITEYDDHEAMKNICINLFKPLININI